MKALRWSPTAAADLDEIAAYLKEHHPHFARPTIRRIYAATKQLKQFPDSGRKGRIAQTRELPLAPLPYLLIYAVTDEAVQVLRILHVARDWRELQPRID
jgi:addiction module RelE/StbE family toxin